MNTATAERQTCLNESPYHNQQLQDTQHTFYHGNDNYEHTSWYWNMNHVPNEDLLVNAKKAYFKSKNASSQQPSAQRSSNSSFQSFFRWFKKDERKQYNGQSEDTQDPNDIISTVQDFENNLDPPNAQEFEGYESSDTLSPPSSPKLGYSASRNNSSCDSIFSTATSSFAFVPAIDYLLQQQGGKSKESTGTDRPYTDSYHRRLKDRDHAREQDRKYNLTLRKKYKLYTDVELQKNDKQASGYDNNLFNKYSNNSTELINQTVHNKLRHRRSTSDSSKDKKSGAYIHVKGKRKAPPPPSPPQLVKNNFSPQSTLGRKKRPAPLPPTTLTSSSNKLQDTILSTSLLEDLEIKSIIDGTSKSLSRNFSPETMKNTSVKMEQTTTSDIYVKTNGIQESPREVSIDNGFKSSNEDQSLNTNLILNSVELREKPSPLPSSPRPWYKRGSANKDTLKGASSKLNFFTRDKKKDREMDKRRSGIFMPNISELDKEAAEIVEAARLKKLQESKKVPEQLVLQYQMNGLDSILDDNEGTSPKSAKELIGLFEASSSHANRITLNPAFIARQDFFGDKKTKFGFDFSDNSIKEKPPTKLPEVDNNAKKKTSEGLLGIWHCPYCTLANQNWKIICQACEKIKPYDKRYCGAEKNKAIEDKPVTKNSWDEKQEQMLKYFNPVPRVPELKSEPISIPDIASKTETLEDKLTNELFEMSYVQSKLSDKEQATAAEKLNDNRRASFEKKVIDKIDFSDPKALELEKERLRDKIRAMNSKALADKYPVIKKIEHSITVTPTVEPTMPQTGAIKKQFPRKPIKPLTEITEKVDNMESKMQGELDQKTTKILAQNSNEKPPKKPETNNLAKSRDNLPISPQLTAKHNFKYENDFNLPLKIELNANKNTNTIAINKILRKLENAISDGKYDDAANLATDLAKMKVSLSVTRQMNNANSKITMKLTDIVVNLIVEDAISNKVPLKVKISPQMTLGELKSQMFRNYEIPVHLQKWNINSKAAEDNVKTLVDYQVYDNTAIIKLLVPGSTRDYLKLRPITNYIKETKLLDIATNNNDNDNDNNNANTDSESDDEKQNEKVGKLENGNVEGWNCPLCTLFNISNVSSCLACTTGKPNVIRQEIKRANGQVNGEKRNDLNRLSYHRKSSEILNIMEEETKSSELKKLPDTSNIILSVASLITSPNITRSRYRGVDNFKPNIYNPIQPITNNVPIIKSVYYKEKSHYMELVNLESSNIVPNMEKFECTICFSDVQPKLGAVLRDCLHHFCKECLVMHIQHNDDVEIKCPFMDNTYSCQSMLQDREVRSLLSKEEYEKYLSKSIRQAEHQIENTFHCKTVNCRGWCVFEEDVNTFKCPVCTIVNCLTCGAIHDGLNCKQYQDHLNIDSECLDTKKTKETLQEMIDKNEAMHCPTCQIFLLKKWGCDWLKCTFCKTEICWCTKGLRWGINGKGDTSGGCKCGVNGVKCSPKCNYCH